MNGFCYTLAIRQIKCQNSIANTTDNVYTNITTGSVVPLGFGYSLTFVSATATTGTIEISNSSFIPNILFNIPSGSYKIFDLPVDSGTLRVSVGLSAINCSNTVACCNLV